VNRLVSALLLASTLVLTGGCGRPPAGAVAIYDGGVVTRQALDGRIRSLSPKDRRPPGGELAAWRQDLIRDLAVEQIVLSEAKKPGRDAGPELAERFMEIERQVVVSACLRKRLGPPAPPSEQELLQAYEKYKESGPQEERREVYHIFRRRADASSLKQLRAEIEGLRARVLAGESFKLLAAEHSDSETRHRQGLMGWFGRGQLAPQLEAVVFGLPPRTPSKVIHTAAGFHLFWVESVTGGMRHSFEDIRGVLARRLAERRREHEASDLVWIEPPAGSSVPSAEQLAALLARGDLNSLVLRVGEFEVRLGGLRRRLAELAASGGLAPSPLDHVRSLKLRELLYLQCCDEGYDQAPEVRRRIAALRDAAIGQHELRQRLVTAALADRDLLESYFARNRGRYREPVRWNLRLATIPLGPKPSDRMARLEAARRALDRGEIRLEELAAELGGKVERLEGRTLAVLGARSPSLEQFVPQLEVGSHSPPYRRADSLEMARCDRRLAPEPLPLERVERRVAEDLLKNQGQEIYREFANRLLEEHQFRLVEPNSP
jgi:hypothetical protein